MTEQEVIKIARDFMVKHGVYRSDEEIRPHKFTKDHYEREKSSGRFPERPGFWEYYMAQHRDHWSVVLEGRRRQGLSPSEIIIVVDDETGEARFMDVM